MVGRLTNQKSPDIFIKFASLIKKEINNSYFIIVGDGEERYEIEAMIKEFGLEKCSTITGWVDEPMKYIQLFDQAFLLSRWEGFGLVLTEYMLAGKPIIATNVDAIPDLINHNYNGVLVEPNNPEEVFKQSLNLYYNKFQRDNLIKHAIECVNQRFDIKRVVNETEKLIWSK